MITMAVYVCGKNVSVVKKGALWDNVSTSRCMGLEGEIAVEEKITNPCWQRDMLPGLC